MKTFTTILSAAAIAVTASAGVGMADEKIKPLPVAKSTQVLGGIFGAGGVGVGGGLAGLGLAGTVAAAVVAAVVVVQVTSGTN